MQTCSGMSIACLLQRVPVADHVDERHQDVEAGAERARVLAEPLDDVGALLRHDDGRARETIHHESGETEDDDQVCGHEFLRCRWAAHSARSHSMSPSTR